MLAARLTVLLVTTALAAGAAASSDWTTFAGGPQRLFFNPTETQVTAANVASLRVKWKFHTGAIVTASPSVAIVDLPGEGPTQVVFVPSWDHTLYAIRLRDGTEVWRFGVPDQPGKTYPNASSVTVGEVNGAPRAFFASGETMHAVDAVTGAEVWHFDAGTGCADPPGFCGFDGERNEIESSALVAENKVVFGMDVNDDVGGKGGLYAVDAVDGRMIWFFDLESGMTCKPDPGDDVRRYDGYHTEIDLGLPDGFLATRPGCNHPRSPDGCGNVWSSAAYDPVRRRLFTDSANCDTDSNPATLKPPPPVPPYDGAIFAVSLDGDAVWHWRPRDVDNQDLDFGAVPNLFTIDVDGTPRDVLGVGGKDGTYYVIDRDGVNARNGVRWDDADHSQLPYWRANLVPGGSIGGIIATAAVDVADGRIHVSTGPGTDVFNPQRPTVHTLDMQTGATLWENAAETTADASFASTSAIPGVVFVGGAASGSLRSYDAATGAHLASKPIAFVLASAPAVVDGTVLVGGGIGTRSEDPTDISDIVSHTPSDVTALCVPHSKACDEDQDGVDFPEDCDDQDPARHPGAREIPGNDVDEDCDGLLAQVGDACLAHGSAGQDRRDLDAVRAQMDASCPCALFRPRRGATAYKRCVKRIIGDAIAAGTLRKVCRPQLELATCGRVPAVVCCETRRRSGAPTCRVKSPRRCTSDRYVTRTPEVGATHCADTDCVLVTTPTTSTTTSTTTATTSTVSSTTTTTLPPSWAAIHAAVIQDTCGSCHGSVESGGGAGGLAGLQDCALGWAALVGVPSGELPSMEYVKAGDPSMSWLMAKLDGIQGSFDAQCVGGSCGSPMPLNHSQLPRAVRDAIRLWIANGAADDCP